MNLGEGRAHSSPHALKQANALMLGERLFSI